MDIRKNSGSRTPPRRSPTKPSIQYPTPDTSEFLIIESKNVDSKDEPIDYGAPHPDASSARLIDQHYSMEADNQKLRTRTWSSVADSSAQDAYNLTLAYLGNSLASRVVTRIYTVPRSSYAPLDKLTPDTVFTDALLTTETTHPIEGDKYHWQVVRIFEELPGPLLTGHMLDPEADGATTTQTTQTIWSTDPEPTLDTKSISYTRQPLDSLKSTQTIGALPEDGTFPTLKGQDYDPGTGITTPYTDALVDAGTSGTAAADITPRNKYQSRQRVYDLTNIAAKLDAFNVTFHGTTDMSLPDTLESIDIVWETSSGDGTYSESGSGIAVGKSASLAMHMHGSGQGSASVIPDIVPIITSRLARNIPCTDYYFFVPNSTSYADIFTKLTSLAGSTVSSWPSFHPVTHVFTLRGQKVSIAANVNAHCAVSISNTDVSLATGSGKGSDKDFGSSIRSVTIGPVIHGAITLSGSASDSSTVNASASADTGSGTNFPGASASESFSATANGSVIPTSLSPTSPAAIPSTGLYCIDLSSELYKYGYTAIRARVIDAANL